MSNRKSTADTSENLTSIHAECDSMTQQQALQGIQVLDLTHVLAGPFCTYQLAVLGANVIKIEAPARPDMTREEGVDAQQNSNNYGSYFQSQSANKKSLAVDLASDAGKIILEKLIVQSDVLVQNYAAGAMEKLGFGVKQVASINPKLVYCSITGFGNTGPKADHPAYDVVIQAFTGLMAANGNAQTGPVRVGPPMVDYGTGVQAALAITAALLQRHLTGKGQRIDVSMTDAAIMLMSGHVTDTLTTGKNPEPNGNSHPYYAGYATFDTKDGLLMIGAYTNRQLAALFDVLGESQRQQRTLSTSRVDIRHWYIDDKACISAHMLKRDADEWEQLLNQAHVPASRVRQLSEALDHEQIASRTILQDSHIDPGKGPAQLPVAAFNYEHGSPTLTAAPPTLGQHTRAILAALDYSRDEIETLCAEGIVA